MGAADDPEGFGGRGVAYFSKRAYDRAIADLDKATTLNPSYANAYDCRYAAGRIKALSK